MELQGRPQGIWRPAGMPGGVPRGADVNGVKTRPGPPRPPTTYIVPDVGFRRGRRGIWRPAGRPRGAPGCGCLTKLSAGLAPLPPTTYRLPDVGFGRGRRGIV